jgi:hypothetical protein
MFVIDQSKDGLDSITNYALSIHTQERITRVYSEHQMKEILEEGYREGIIKDADITQENLETIFYYDDFLASDIRNTGKTCSSEDELVVEKLIHPKLKKKIVPAAKESV